eukprot:g1562.t1
MELYHDLETEFGLDGAGVGSLSSMYFYIYGIVQIPYGILMDKYGPLRVISSSAFFTFIGALCFSLSPSLFVAYVGRGLVGGAVGVGWIAIIKVIQDDDYFLGKKQVLTGLSLSMGMLGGSLGQAFASLWAVPFFIQVGGVDRATAGVIATCFIIGTGIGGPVGGAISDRFKQRERQIMICSLLITSSMLLLVILGTGYWHISISGIIMLIVSNSYCPKPIS